MGVLFSISISLSLSPFIVDAFDLILDIKYGCAANAIRNEHKSPDDCHSNQNQNQNMPATRSEIDIKNAQKSLASFIRNGVCVRVI